MATNSNLQHDVVAERDVVGAQHAVPQLARASKSNSGFCSIQSLKSNISESDAIRKFSTFGPASILRNLRLGPLQRLAQVYVPFRLYRVDYDLAREHQSRLFAIDSVEGSLDLFEFPSVPEKSALSQIETRNALPANLSDDRSQELLREKVLRVIFQQGFFKLRDANLVIERIPLDQSAGGGALHLPYWLAFHGTNTVRCRVLDATRNRIEGAKASALFESWLAS